MTQVTVLNDVEVAAENVQDDGSVEVCIEAVGPAGLLGAKLYFADQASADAYKNPN